MTNTLEQIRGRLQRRDSFMPDRRRSLVGIKHRLGVELNDKERESFTRKFQVLPDVPPPSELFRKPIKDESDPTIGKEALKSYIRGSLGIPKTLGTSIEKAGVELQTEGVKGGSTRFKRPEFFGSELASKAGKFLENTGSSIRKFFGNIAEEYESNYLKDKNQLSFNMLKDPMFYASTLPETAVSMIPSLLVGGAAFKTTQILGKTFKMTPKIIRKMAMINAAVAGGFVGGELESANTYEEALRQGKSEQEAVKLTNMMTLASGALNALSIAKIFSKTGAGIAGKILKFLGSGATEGTTEWAEEPAEALILGKDIKEAMKQGTIVIPAAAIMGGSASLTIGGGAGDAAKSVTKDVEPQVEEGVTDEDKLQRGVKEIQEEDIVIDEEVLNELGRQQKAVETPANSLDEIKARLFKNVIPEEGKGTDKPFRPVLEKEATVPHETIGEFQIGEEIPGHLQKDTIEAMVEAYKKRNPVIMNRPISFIKEEGKLELIEGEHRFFAAKQAGVEPPMVVLTREATGELNAPQVDQLARKSFTGKNTKELTSFFNQEVKKAKGKPVDVPRETIQAKPFTQTMFRGVSEATPLDTSPNFIGTYYTSIREAAEEFATDFSGKPGKVISKEINLKNPITLKEDKVTGIEEIPEIKDLIKGIKKEGMSQKEFDAKKAEILTEKLIAKGHDGVLYVDETGKTIEAIVFPRETIADVAGAQPTKLFKNIIKEDGKGTGKKFEPFTKTTENIIKEEAGLIKEEISKAVAGENLYVKDEFGVTTEVINNGIRSTFPPYYEGLKIPKKDLIEKIQKIIDGKITAKDKETKWYQRLTNLIQKRTEGIEKRFTPGTGREDPFRINESQVRSKMSSEAIKFEELKTRFEREFGISSEDISFEELVNFYDLQAAGTTEERHAGLNLFKLIPKKQRDAFRQFFKPFILLSKESEVLFERSKARGAVKRTEDFITKTKKKIDVHPLEVRKDIFRYLDDTIDITDLPENARGLAISIRNAQMRIGRALVKRGLLKKEAFESLKGKYVHYIYARHIIGEEIEVDASKLVTPTGKLNMTYLISRNPNLTHEDRIALGLIEDAGIAVPVGMGKALIDIAKFDYLDRLADPELDIIWKPSTVKVGNKRWGISKLAKEVQAQSNLVATNTKNGIENKPAIERLRILSDALDKAKEKMGAEPKDFRQIPDSVKFGNLAGAFIRTPVYNDIMPLVTPLSSNVGVGKLFQAFAKFNSQVTGLFKAGKVALNPPTMFRNTISNLLQNNMRGRMLSLIPKDMIMALKGMIDKDSDFITAKRNGLFESNFAAAELNEVLKELNEVNISHWDSFLTFVGNISKYYGKIDDIAKFTIYKQLRTSGKLNRLGIGDGVPAPIEYAILEAQKWGMDYSLASRSVKHLRRHIIPFSTYQYKIAPLILESLEKRPWVIGKFVALLGVGSFSIAQILVKDYFDVDDDEWEKLLKQLPHYIKANKTFVPLPWKSPEGEWQWVNGEYFMPWGTWSTIARDVKGGEIFEAFKSVGVGNPILSVFQVLQSGARDKPPVDPFTKQPLWNQLDEPGEKYLKLFSWLTNLVAPSVLENVAVKDAPRQGALGTTIRSVKSKVIGVPERDKWGRTLTAGQAIGKWFGFNITTISPEQTAVIKYARMKNLQKELIKKYTDPRISNDSKTLEKARKNFMEEMNKIRENQ